MIKKLSALVTCMGLAALATAPASSATYSWKFVSVCSVPAPNVCPSGPNPIWFGKYNTWTQAQCNSARLAISKNALFGMYPRVLSNCTNLVP